MFGAHHQSPAARALRGGAFVTTCWRTRLLTDAAGRLRALAFGVAANPGAGFRTGIVLGPRDDQGYIEDAMGETHGMECARGTVLGLPDHGVGRRGA